MAKLKPKQERFVREYLIDLNATRAAARAGYSKKTARMQGSRLMTNDVIRERIDKLKEKRNGKLEITSDVILRELLRISTSDICVMFNDDGSARPFKDLTEDQRRVISGVEIEEIFTGKGEDRRHAGYTKKFKFWDKPKALELLGKHLKLFTDKIEVGGDESFLDILTEARKIADEKKAAKKPIRKAASGS